MNNKHSLGIYFLLWTFFGSGFTPEQEQSQDFPTLESSQVEFFCSEGGVVKYRLLTNEALHYQNGDRIYPEGMHIEFYEDNQEISLTGRANSVYFFAKNNVYKFRGDVEIKSLRDQKQLNTEELHWNTETETFYTDKFIRIETKEELLTGEGLTAKQDLSSYAVSKPQGLSNVKSIK